MADGVYIDTDQVGEFSKDLRTEASGGFAEAATRGAHLHGQGVDFGTEIHAGAVQEAKRRYALALEHTEANLQAYVLAADALARVADQIARDFANADMSSAETQHKIQALLNGALSQAQALLLERTVQP